MSIDIRNDRKCILNSKSKKDKEPNNREQTITKVHRKYLPSKSTKILKYRPMR